LVEVHISIVSENYVFLTVEILIYSQDGRFSSKVSK